MASGGEESFCVVAAGVGDLPRRTLERIPAPPRYALRRFIVSEEHFMKVLHRALRSRSVPILDWMVGAWKIVRYSLSTGSTI